MDEVLRIAITNLDAPVIIFLIIWIIIQVNKLETKIAIIQNDINHLRKEIYPQD